MRDGAPVSAAEGVTAGPQGAEGGGRSLGPAGSVALLLKQSPACSLSQACVSAHAALRSQGRSGQERGPRRSGGCGPWDVRLEDSPVSLLGPDFRQSRPVCFPCYEVRVIS